MNISNFFPPTLNPFKETDVRAAVAERSGIVAEQGMLIASMDGVSVTDPASLERFFEHLGDEMELLNRAVLAQAHLIAAMREFWNEDRRAQLAALTPEQRAAQTEHPMARFLRDLAAQAKATGDAPASRAVSTTASKLSPEVRAALKAEAAKMRAEAEHDGQVPVLAVITTPDGDKVVVDADGNEAPDWMKDLAAHIEANKGGDGPTGTSGFGGFGGDFGNGTVH